MRNCLTALFLSGLFCLSLQAEEKDGGFTDLLNGKDLTGWETTGNWVYEDGGVLALKPRPGERGWKRYSAYLYLAEPVKDFVFDFEFKYTPNGNSGFFFKIADMKDPVSTGFEVQILDCFGKKGPLGHHDMGGIIRTQGASKNMCKPAGEWNRMVVTCRGPRLQVELNGEMVQDLDLAAKAEQKLPEKGYLAIQDHGQPFWVRNLRLKKL